MQVLSCNAAALGIAVLYYIWRDRMSHHLQLRHALRERVTYMLWVAANQAA
jgi:hypothetical protein